MSNNNNNNNKRPPMSTSGSGRRPMSTVSGSTGRSAGGDTPRSKSRTGAESQSPSRQRSTLSTTASPSGQRSSRPETQRATRSQSQNSSSSDALRDIRAKSRRETPQPQSSGGGSGSNGGGSGGKRRRIRKDKIAKTYSGLSFPKKIITVLVTLMTLGAVLVTSYTTFVLRDIPPIDATILNKALEQQSVIYDSKGKVIEIVKDDIDRKIIKFDQISKKTIDAIIAIEDKTFWEHKGFNFIRLAGSVVDSITKRESIKGTSTITQQLARNIYLSKEKTLDRKIKEAYYANQIEKQIDKNDIITGYLNTIFLGSGAYGIEAAANRYFSKPAKDLDWVESAMLVGVPSAPSAYSPVIFLNKENVKKDNYVIDDSNSLYVAVYNPNCEKRYAVVLSVLKNQGKITQAQYDKYSKVDLKKRIKFKSDLKSSISSYASDIIKRQVVDGLVAKYNLTFEEANNYLYTKGLQINSTIDIELQKNLEAQYRSAKATGLIPGVSVRYGSGSNIIGENGSILLYNYKNLVNSKGQFYLTNKDYSFNKSQDLVIYKRQKLYFYPVYEGKRLTNIRAVIKNSYKPYERPIKSYEGFEIDIPAEDKSFDNDGNLVISSNYLKSNPSMFKKQSNGIITIPKNSFSISRVGVPQPQSSTVIIDHHNGALIALSGGIGIEGQKLFNRATNPRQPGSAIKPISVYLPALESNRYNAHTIVVDEPVFFGPNGSRWPVNWQETYNTGIKNLGAISIQRAVAISTNVVAAKVAKDLGTSTCMSSLKRLGITTIDNVNDNNLAAMALGGMTRGISPLEITRAYAAIANEGKMMDFMSFTTVKDLDGNIILENKPNGKQVIDKGVASAMTDILKYSADTGLASPARMHLPVAGKTGTTDDSFDLWFVGYTPYYTSAVWFGSDVNMTLNSTTTEPAIFWKSIMEKAVAGKPYKGFFESTPSTTTKEEYKAPEMLRVCSTSKMLAGSNCPSDLVINVEKNNDNAKKYNFKNYCDVHTSTSNQGNNNNSNQGSNTETSNAYIVESGGGYKVVKSFTLTLNNGKKISVPPGSKINGDFSFTLSSGKTIPANEVSSYPDINDLLGQ